MVKLVHPHTNVAVAELADALASGASGGNSMRVRLPLATPTLVWGQEIVCRKA